MKCLRVIDICVLTLVTRVHGHDSSDDGSDEWRTASRRHRRLRKALISERRDLGVGPVVPPIFCSSNMDCNSTMYCAAGECLEMGSCETNMDCRNPSNLHLVEQGSGPLICLEHNKQCGLECGPACEDGLKPADQQCGYLGADHAHPGRIRSVLRQLHRHGRLQPDDQLLDGCRELHHD